MGDITEVAPEIETELRATIADRDRQIGELENALIEQGRLNETIPSMQTQIAALEDTVAEQTKTMTAAAVARRESEARLVEGNVDTMRAAGVSDTHDDSFGTGHGNLAIPPDLLTELQAEATATGGTIGDAILARLAK